MNLPDALLTEAKRQAATEGLTLTSLVEESLRASLSRPARRTSTRPSLPTWSGASAAGHLVDLRDKQGVWEALDQVR